MRNPGGRLAERWASLFACRHGPNRQPSNGYRFFRKGREVFRRRKIILTATVGDELVLHNARSRSPPLPFGPKKPQLRRHTVKTRSLPTHSVSRATLLASSLGFALVSHAADQTWINANANNDWNTTSATNWDAGVAWTQGNNAIFGGTGETVTLTEAISAGGLTFGASNYIISGNTLTLTTGVDTGAETARINSTLGGTGFTKSGTGTLVLGSTNFGGMLTVSQGRLELTSATSLGGTGSLIIGDGNSGATAPNVFFNNATPSFVSLTVDSGVTDAAIYSNSWAQNVTGSTTLNSPLKIVRTTGGGVHGGFQNSGSITGNGGGAGNDSLIFEHGGGGNFYWQANNTTGNDFAGNIHIMGAGSMNAQGGSNGPNNVVIPDAAMVTIDTGSSFVWNNFGGNSVVETIDGLAGGGTMTRNIPSGLVPNLTITINANNPANEGDRIFTGTLSGLTGPLTLGGTGTQEFSGSGVTYATATSLNNGTLKLTNTSAWGSSIAIGASNAPAVQLNAPLEADAWNFTKQITGANASATVNKTGAGTVTVTVPQSYTGPTQVQGGKLLLSSGTALPTGFPSISGMTVWLDAADPDGNNVADTTDASTVSTWVNKGTSGATGNFTTTGGGSDPVFTLSSSSFNNQPVITFDDAGKQLVNGTNFTNTLSVVYVGRIGATKQRLVSGNTVNWLLGYWNGNMNTNYWNGGSLGSAADTNAHIWISGATGGSYAGYRFDTGGEVSIGTGSGSAPTAGLMLGGGWAGNEKSDGEIAELFVFDHQLTTTERQQLEGYLYNKYFGSEYGIVSINGASAVSVTNGATLGGNGTAGDIAVADGGALEGTYNGTGTFTANAVTLGAAAADTTTLKGTISAGGKPIKVSSLTINGGNEKVLLNGSGTGLVNGTTYDLLESDTVITAPNASNVLSSLKSSSRSYTPVVDGTGKKIQLYYDANASIYWSGASSNVWSTGTTNNWKLSGNNSTTQFLANDVVFFHDSPSVSTVDIANENVTPLSTTFDNTTATEYTLESTGDFGITTGTITKSGDGTVNFTNHNLTPGAVALNGGNAFLWYEDSLGTGPITFDGGQLTYDGGFATWTRNFTINAGGASVNVTGNAGLLSQTGTVSGTGSLVKTGPGILALGGNNETWTTGFTVSQGTLQIASGGNSNAFGTGPITLGDANSGAETLALGLHGILSSTVIGNVTVANQGGGTSIRGTLNSTGANANAAIPTLTLNKQVTLRQADGAPTGRACDLLFGTITGAGAGAGNDTLVIDGGSAIVRTSVTDTGTASTFTGNVHVTSGTWQMQNRAYLGYTAEHSNLIVPDTSDVTVDSGATWGITHSLDETIGGLNGAGTVMNRFSSQTTTLIVGGGNANGDFSGVVQGGSSGLALKKIGSGTQILSGENTYGGGTTVEAGTLVLNNTAGSGAGSGTVTVQSGATLSGTGSASGATTIAAGATVAPGNSAGTLTLGSATLVGAYQCQLDGASGDHLAVTGELTIDPAATISVSTLSAPTEPEYTILTYGSLVGTLPTITGVPAGYSVDTSTPGVVKISDGSGDPYTTWIDSFTSLTNPADKEMTADPDQDGLANVIEFVLDGNPANGTITNLPTLTDAGANMVFTFTRRDDSESLNPTVEFDADLAGAWTTAVDGSNCTIVVTENGTNPDTVTVTISKGANTKLFARLKVTP